MFKGENSLEPDGNKYLHFLSEVHGATKNFTWKGYNSLHISSYTNVSKNIVWQQVYSTV